MRKKYTRSQSQRKIEKLIKEIYELKGYQELVNFIEKGIENQTYNYIKHKESKLIAFLKDNFSNKVIIGDEIHSTRLNPTDKEDSKKISKYLEKIARYCNNTRFILLTATPIYNNITDMIWLLNLLLANDKRGLLKNIQILKHLKLIFYQEK